MKYYRVVFYATGYVVDTLDHLDNSRAWMEEDVYRKPHTGFQRVERYFYVETRQNSSREAVRFAKKVRKAYLASGMKGVMLL